jgi:hypothetical protein
MEISIQSRFKCAQEVFEEQIDWRESKKNENHDKFDGKSDGEKNLQRKKNFFILRKKLMKTLFFSAIVNASLEAQESSVS